MKLFMVYLGGSAPGANIELHDVRFVVGEHIVDTYPQLRAQWFGQVKGLHLDSYLALQHIDGYEITLVTTPIKQDVKLYFVNFGGYYPNKIAEQHDFTVCVARSAAEAKAKAKASLLTDAQSQHKDDLLMLDECLSIDEVNGYYIQLQAKGHSQPLIPDWSGYEVIG
ncbi:DUF1543 domain-containing protein [Alishewanella tabrizica]|uniref:DUF1543 domain-containing protein n=1 Tax=Alishewanella tabrizica TaxID=671278 RepID=A0ABQ2WG41_9ALTE|nr:DUF1543 domain-containing protein [Alishewanella tabrizica]GGW53036.1 hypothetical protein GCM10008111_06470 [Alishewanella tabrizica]